MLEIFILKKNIDFSVNVKYTINIIIHERGEKLERYFTSVL